MRKQVLAALFAGVLVTAACTDSSGDAGTAGSSSQRQPANGALAWGDDGCQRQYTAAVKLWTKTLWCRQSVGPAIYDYRVGPSLQYRTDDSDPEVHAVYSYTTRAWTGVSRRDNANLVRTAQGWLTLSQAIAAAQEAARLQGQQCGVGGTNPCAIPVRSDPQGTRTTSVSRAQVEAVLAEWNARLGMIWTQPECNFSYNGCR